MKSKNNTLQLLGLLALAFAGLSTHSAEAAATYTWDAGGGATTTWATATNWNPDGVPTFVAGDTFDLSQINITATGTSTMSAATTLGNILIGDATTSSHSWTLVTGGFLNFDNGASAATITQTATSFGDTISGTYTVASDLNLINNSTGNKTLTLSGVGTINKSNATLTQSGSSATGIVALTGGLAFNSSSGTTFATSGTTATTTQIGALTFASTASAMTLSGSAFTLSGNITNSSTTNSQIINNAMAFTTSRTITTTTAGGITLGGLLSGTGGTLNMVSSGTVTISNANNTYTGGTTIGTTGATGTKLLVTASGALGSGTVTIGGNSSDAVLQLSGGITLSNTVFVNGRGNSNPSIQNISGNNTLSGVLDLRSGGAPHHIQSDAGLLTIGTAGNTAIGAQSEGGNRTVTFQGAGNSAVVGNIINGTGTAALVTLAKTGAGTLTLSGTNTYTGTTTVTAGTLTLSNALALQNSALDTTNSIAGTSAAGLKTTVTTLTLGGLTGNKNLASVFTTTSGGYSTVTALTLNPGTGVTNAYSGVIADGAAGMTLTKTGLGTQTFSGANTYTGATAVNAGTLKAGVVSVANASGAFGNNSAVTMADASGATLDITGFNTQIGSLAGGGTTGGNVTLGAATLTTGGANTNTSFAGVISGTSGALTKIGTGTQTLTGTNTYTGITSINAGKLLINNTSGSGTGTGAVNVTGGVLGGNGTINGATTISAGAIHTAGDAVTAVNVSGAGTIDQVDFGSGITYNQDSIFEWNLTANAETSIGTRGVNYDAVNTAALATNGTEAIFRVVLNGGQNFAEDFWNSDRTWSDIFTNLAGSTSLNIENTFAGTVQYWNSTGEIANANTTGRSFSISGTTLTWTAVPEPTTALSGLLLTAGLLRRRRKN